MFKVEIRKDCKICHKKITGKRFRSFCSKQCRNRHYNTKYSAEHIEWQRKRRDTIASVASAEKVQCLICKKWYVQLCTHTYQVHGVTGREYREHFNLEVKRGVIPDWYRKEKGDTTIENGTIKNLQNGAKFRFKKGQKGVGVYERSPVTIERLKRQFKNKHICSK